jgi:mannose-6-phosphate isomerase-like protein (cupin superfamily)
VVRDVKLLPQKAAARPAKINDNVHEDTAVRTGIESRAELTFTDQTLTRLGANTIFSFSKGTRDMELSGGAMLLRVPKNAGGAQINTAAVTAAITGTTVMLEYHRDAYIKFIVLEGTGRMFLKGHLGQSVLVHAGQMLIVRPDATSLPDPVDIDLDRLISTSLLITGFPPLASWDLLLREINLQTQRKSAGDLIDTNLVIFGRGNGVTLLDPTQADTIDQALNQRPPTQPAPPGDTEQPPSKFGALAVIPAPTPYQITSATTIQTDPVITTNGASGFGKIYRGPGSEDGALSHYLLGLTSSFDTNIGLDTFFATRGEIAAFKFEGLQLQGNPTLDFGAGGPSNLALVSTSTITSGGPGGVLTFTGIDSLLLATVSGSITLGPEISFSGIPSLFIYARGLNSDLNMGAAVTGTDDLLLVAQRNILLTSSLTDSLSLSLIAGGNITILNGTTLSAEVLDVAAGGNLEINGGSSLIAGMITLSAQNELSLDGVTLTASTLNMSSAGDLNIALTSGVTINAPAITISADGAIDLGSAATLMSDASGLSSGGSILLQSDLTAGSGITIASGARLLSLADAGVAGGSISLSTAGADIVIHGGIFEANLGTISIVQTGAPNATSLVAIDNARFTAETLAISSLNDLEIGQSGLVTFDAASISLFAAHDLDLNASFLDAPVSTSNGSVTITAEKAITASSLIIDRLHTGGTAASNVTVTAGTDLTVNGSVAIQTASGNILLSTTLGDLAVTGPGNGLSLTISNSGHTIASGGNLTLDIGGDLTLPDDGALTLQILNNNGGRLINGGNITLTTLGDLTAGFLIALLNNQNGGSIAGNAAINLSAVNLSADSLSLSIDNSGGSIAGSSIISLALSGAFTTHGDADFLILGSPETTPNARLTVSAKSINIGGALTASISDGNGSVFGTQNLSITSTGNITVGSNIFVGGSLTAGGSIVAPGDIIVSGPLTAAGNITSSKGGVLAPTISAGGALFATSLNCTVAQVGSNLTIDNSIHSPEFVLADTLTAGGTLSLINVLGIQPLNSSSDGTIGFTPADFSLSVASIATTGPSFPYLTSNGSDATPAVGYDNPGNGGRVTLNINGTGLTIGRIGALTKIQANGGTFAANSTLGGNGGTIDITAQGNVTLKPGGTLKATSGAIPAEGPATLGNGGTVSLTSNTGAVIVNSTVKVSSNDRSTGSARRSAKGGNINLTSHRSAPAGERGLAIYVPDSGQLLSLLNAAAPGPGGKITILADGANSDVNIEGRVEATRGTIDIRHTAEGGHVAIGEADLSSTNLRADIIKAGAFGANGQLIIGQGALTADTQLKLYAPGSHGEINFVANVTLTSNSSAILAGDTITIQPHRVVTIAGKGGPASVFTNNANYSGFGGTNDKNGTFGGHGAFNPQPLANAPPFDSSGANLRLPPGG